MSDSSPQPDWESTRPRRRTDLLVIGALVAVLVIAGVMSRSDDRPVDELAASEVESTRTPAPSTPTASVPGPEVGEWQPMARAPFRPTAASDGVWTGEQLLVWDHTDTGAIFGYDPNTDTWQAYDVSPASSIGGHAMVWTGSEVLIWGGRGAEGQVSATGLRFDPESGWSAMAASPLGARTDVGATWDPYSERLAIWGGETAGGFDTRFPADGATYDPVTDSWAMLPDVQIEGRADPTVLALQPGTAIVGGRAGSTDLATGVLIRRDDIVPIPAPPVSYDQQVAYAATGEGEVLVWGRPADFSDEPGFAWTADNGWRNLSRLLNQERAAATARLRDSPEESLLVVWGGLERRGVERVTDGFWLDIHRGRWGTFRPAPLSARSDAVVVLTGSELLVWGGSSGGTVPTDGARVGLPPPPM